MRKSILASLLILVVGLGCSSEPASPSTAGPPTASSVGELVSLLQQTTSYSFIAYPNPAAMLREVDLAVVGTVSSVDAAMIADELDGQGAVIVGLETTEVWKDDPDRTGEIVYYWFHRPKDFDVGMYRAALPLGTEVVLFGFDMNSRTRFSSGAPNATVYDPAPQGLYLPVQGDGLVNVWGEHIEDADWAGIRTVEDLRKAVAQ